MRKGDWYMVSGASGVLALHRIAEINWDTQSLTFDAYYKNLDFEGQPSIGYPIHAYLSDLLFHPRNKVTRIKARDARNLLKLLQRKLP